MVKYTLRNNQNLEKSENVNAVGGGGELDSGCRHQHQQPHQHIGIGFEHHIPASQFPGIPGISPHAHTQPPTAQSMPETPFPPPVIHRRSPPPVTSSPSSPRVLNTPFPPPVTCSPFLPPADLLAVSPCPFHPNTDTPNVTFPPGGGINVSHDLSGLNSYSHKRQTLNGRESMQMTQVTHASHPGRGRSLITQPKYRSESSGFMSAEENVGAKVRFTEDKRQDIMEQRLMQQSESAEVGIGIANDHVGIKISGSDTQDVTSLHGQQLLQESKSKSAEVDIGRFHAGITVTKSHTEKNQPKEYVSPAQPEARGVSGVGKVLGVTVLPGGGLAKQQTIQQENSTHQSGQTQNLEWNEAKQSASTFEEFRASGVGGARARFADSEQQLENGLRDGAVRQDLGSTNSQKSKSAEINIGGFHAGITESRAEQRHNQCQQMTSKGEYTREGKGFDVANVIGGGSEPQTRITSTDDISSPRLAHARHSLRHSRDSRRSLIPPTRQPNPLCDPSKVEHDFLAKSSSPLVIPPRIPSSPSPCSPGVVPTRIMPPYSRSASPSPRSPVLEFPGPIFSSPPPFVTQSQRKSPSTVSPRLPGLPRMSSPLPRNETVIFDANGAKEKEYHNGGCTRSARTAEGVKTVETAEVTIIGEARTTNVEDRRVSGVVSGINITGTSNNSDARMGSGFTPTQPGSPVSPVYEGVRTVQADGHSIRGTFLAKANRTQSEIEFEFNTDRGDCL